MTTATQPSFVIPAGTLSAAAFLIDLRKRPAITVHDWRTIQHWLLTTSFDNGNFVAGEAALALIRDLASPKTRREIAEALAKSDLLPRLKALLPEVVQGPKAEKRPQA